MTFAEWLSEPANWVFAVLGVLVLASGFRVVTARNVVHAALFLLLSAEFVAWVLVLVYIGAVIVLFLFGIMITRAPTGYDKTLDADRKLWPAALSVIMFVTLAWASIDAFGARVVADLGEPTTTETIGLSLLGRFVIPFEVVSFVLLAALIGGVTIARRDLEPAEEEQRRAV